MELAALGGETLPVISGPIQRLLTPSLADCLFMAVLVWAFAAGSGWTALLADGDTGWHIRTGDFIIETGRVPTQDLFSFSKSGQPWFAWEWLADVCFAALHRQWGLKGVVAFTGLVLSGSLSLLFRHMLWRGANVLAALVFTLLAAGASSIHYLARPHIFTLLFVTISLWLLDRDRRRPSYAVWWLAPISALWANLHGGFLGWIACLALVTAGTGLQGPENWARFRRYSLLTLVCSAATLLNPYGYRLHAHALEYLRSGWVREAVEEFQSPRFRSESMLQFEILLILGLAAAAGLIQRKRWGELLLVVFWAHAALVSVRHVPVYAIVSAPVMALEASMLWTRWSQGQSRRSVAGTVRDLLSEFSGKQHTSVWIVVLPALLLCLDLGSQWPVDFPDGRFPVAAVTKNLPQLAPADRPAPRILTSDQWGDYLIYRLYPRIRVFVDGRSDFYGPEIGKPYLHLMNPEYTWDGIVAQYGFDLALLPVEWPLAELLKRSKDWRLVYDDHRAILFARKQTVSEGLNQKPDSVERYLRRSSQ